MSNLVDYAKDELKRIGMIDSGEEYNDRATKAILDLIELFASQGHTGFSAPYVVNAFSRLARFKPLSPLTGKDDEWNELIDGSFQNKRYSAVFKEKDGTTYDINGKVFTDDGKLWYTCRDSKVNVTFPYVVPDEPEYVYRHKTESEGVQPKQTDDSCLDFDFDKVKEILKRDDLDDLIVDHTCEEKQKKTIDAIDFAIKITDSQDDYFMGMRNGMRYVKSLIDGKEPQYEIRRSDEEIKLGIDLGDEVVSDYGAKGVVVGIDTYEGDVVLSLLMRNHKVPQLVKASGYKTKTGRHFQQIIEVLEQMKGETDGK